MTTVTSAAQGYDGPTRSHADQRDPRTGTDQHGRRWNWQVEKKSGEPCDSPQPIGWTPPFPQWFPQPRYLRCGRNWAVEGRRLGMEEVRVDYAAWKAELRDSHQTWQERYFALGHTMAGDRFDPEAPGPQISGAVGPRPMPVEVVMAMEQGNRFALGLTDLVDERLRPYFPVSWKAPEPDFTEHDFAETPSASPPAELVTVMAEAREEDGDVAIPETSLPFKRGPGRPRKVSLE